MSEETHTDWLLEDWMGHAEKWMRQAEKYRQSTDQLQQRIEKLREAMQKVASQDHPWNDEEGRCIGGCIQCLMEDALEADDEAAKGGGHGSST